MMTMTDQTVFFQQLSSEAFQNFLREKWVTIDPSFYIGFTRSSRLQRYKDGTSDRHYYVRIDFDRGDQYDTVMLQFELFRGKIHFVPIHQAFETNNITVSVSLSKVIEDFSMLGEVLYRFVQVNILDAKKLFS